MRERRIIQFDRERPFYRARRIMRDRALILKAKPGHPLPMRTAPWAKGPVRNGIYWPGEQPVAVHMWSHFEVFFGIEDMLLSWVLDEMPEPTDIGAK